MIEKEILFGSDAKQKLINGVNIVADAVKVTLGAAGRNVAIEDERGLPHLSKDGVTVARSINLSDPTENLGASIIKQASTRSADNAGDGPQPLDSSVLTPKGWVKLEDTYIGQEVCGTHGTKQTILGIYPKGNLKIHEVVFGDGRVVECSSNHLWTVTTNSGIKKTITTEEMMKDFLSKKQCGSIYYKYFVETSGVNFNQNGPMPLDPFLVGLLLGDGSLSGTGGIELSLGLNKESLIKRIILPEGLTTSVRLCEEKNYYRVRINGTTSSGLNIFDILNSMDLLGTKSETKFIPNNYLYSPIEDRVRLLDGLLSTDGYINKRGLFEFSTVSNQLADDFQELISSLGYSFNRRLHTREKDLGSYSNKSIHRIVQLSGYKYGAKIVDIRDTGIETEMMCIKVSNEDHLYITDNYIPTHNTTTTAVLTQSIVNKAITLIDEKTNITQFKKGMQVASNDIVEALKKQSKKVNNKTLKSVARISANNDAELGDIIADAYLKVGVDGAVTMEESMSSKTYVEIIDGTKIKKGYNSPYLVTNQQKQEAVLENPLVFVSDQEIKSLEDILPLCEAAMQNKRSLLIISDVEDGVMNTLNVNKAKGVIKVNVVSPEGFGIKRFELLQDLCALTGATLASDETGNDLSTIDSSYLGEAFKCISDVHQTILITDREKYQDDIEARLVNVRESISNSENKMDLWHYEDRLGRLCGGIAVVKVGANSEVEMKEKKDRVDDAIKATKAALEEGILPGGGIAFIDVLNSLKEPNLDSDFGKGYTSVWYALSSPLNQILKNAGVNPQDIYSDIAREDTKGFGYNVITEKLGDMFKMGVIDATKVLRNAIENAVSVSSILLTTEATITNKRQG